MADGSPRRPAATDVARLPQPAFSGRRSVETALRLRRSVRDYTGEPLTRAELAQLLWAAQGITGAEGLRTAPSAGALYPLEVYVCVGDVIDLPAGIYRYEPGHHALVIVASGDRRAELCAAALGQPCVEAGAVVIALAADYGRTGARYGKRGIRYVHMEAGHAAQNVYLQAAALELGTVVVGAFDDEVAQRILGMPSREEPLCLMPVGRIAVEPWQRRPSITEPSPTFSSSHWADPIFSDVSRGSRAWVRQPHASSSGTRERSFCRGRGRDRATGPGVEAASVRSQDQLERTSNRLALAGTGV